MNTPILSDIKVLDNLLALNLNVNRGGPLVRTGNSGSLACLFPH